MLNLLRQVFGHARTEAPAKPVVRSAWDGSPNNLLVEMPEGHWRPVEPWMYETFDVRLDPFTCDPDPEDLQL